MAYIAHLGDPPLPCVVCISEEEAYEILAVARRTTMERITRDLRESHEELRALLEEFKDLALTGKDPSG